MIVSPRVVRVSNPASAPAERPYGRQASLTVRLREVVARGLSFRSLSGENGVPSSPDHKKKQSNKYKDMKTIVKIMAGAAIVTSLAIALASCTTTAFFAAAPHPGTYTHNAYATVSPEPLPEVLSRDPYNGKGTRSQYLALARQYEARSLQYQAGAARIAESQYRNIYNGAKRASNMVSGTYSRNSYLYAKRYGSALNGGSPYNTSYGNTYSDMLMRQSRMLESRAAYDKYMQMARQAKAEQMKYIELARSSQDR